MSYKKYKQKSDLVWRIKNPTLSQEKNRKKKKDQQDRNKKFVLSEIEKRGCCEFCFMVDSPEVYQWHHIDDEDPTKTQIGKLWHNGLDRLQRELDKCVMLCPTCHHKFHMDLLCMLDHKEKHENGTYFSYNVDPIDPKPTKPNNFLTKFIENG